MRQKKEQGKGPEVEVLAHSRCKGGSCEQWYSIVCGLKNYVGHRLKCTFLSPTSRNSDSTGLGWGPMDLHFLKNIPGNLKNDIA